MSKKARSRSTEIHQQLLPMWVVYDHPRDFPDGFIARKWWVGSTAEPTLVKLSSGTLEGVRALLPRGFYRIERYHADDPCIVEVWL